MPENTRARPAAAVDDVVARLRRWGASDYDTYAYLTLDGASIAWVPWIRHATDLHADMLDAAAAIEARDAEIARLREALRHILACRHMHPMVFALAIDVASAALAPQPASDGGTP